VLVYFQASEETLWKRIEQREADRISELRNGGTGTGDSVYKVTREVLRRYVNGFQVPQGEGEIIIQVL
jgi:hypothetical protein